MITFIQFAVGVLILAVAGLVTIHAFNVFKEGF